MARAMAASLLYNNGVPTPALAQEAKSAADRAMALAPDRPLSHRALSGYHRSISHQPKLALAEAEIARRLAPGDASMLAYLASAERLLGRMAEAVRDGQAAAVLDPRSAAVARTLSQSLLWSRRVSEARTASARALALAPGSLESIYGALMVELAAGDLDAVPVGVEHEHLVEASDVLVLLRRELHADLDPAAALICGVDFGPRVHVEGEVLETDLVVAMASVVGGPQA